MLRSNGGVMSSLRASEQPVALVRSGPSGGIIASQQLGLQSGLGDLIAADMGGTSFEACLLPDGRPAFTNHEEFGRGIPIAVTMVDARSIGAGGGSIARVDTAGILRVGPQSAGADPGPACYRRGGTEPTVTDANAVLGRLAPEFRLAGDYELDFDAAASVVNALATQLGLDGIRVAQGIVAVANNNMAQALRLVSTDRGYDPRGAALVAYGGAGPLHACELARALQMRSVVIPRYPGAFSAFGALLADARFDYSKTYWMRMRDLDLDRVSAIFGDLEGQAVEEFRHENFREAPVLSRAIDVRYVGQNWELEIPVPGGETREADFDEVARRFADEHERFYGYHLPGEELEILTFKVSAIGSRHELALPRIASGATPAPIARRPVVFADGVEPVETPLYRREALPAGADDRGAGARGTGRRDDAAAARERGARRRPRQSARDHLKEAR